MDAKIIFEIADKRFAICKECPMLNTALNRCNDCGCLMLLKTKVPTAECPQGKWGKYEIEA